MAVSRSVNPSEPPAWYPAGAFSTARIAGAGASDKCSWALAPVGCTKEQPSSSSGSMLTTVDHAHRPTVCPIMIASDTAPSVNPTEDTQRAA